MTCSSDAPSTSTGLTVAIAEPGGPVDLWNGKFVPEQAALALHHLQHARAAGAGLFALARLLPRRVLPGRVPGNRQHRVVPHQERAGLIGDAQTDRSPGDDRPIEMLQASEFVARFAQPLDLRLERCEARAQCVGRFRRMVGHGEKARASGGRPGGTGLYPAMPPAYAV